MNQKYKQKPTRNSWSIWIKSVCVIDQLSIIDDHLWSKWVIDQVYKSKSILLASTKSASSLPILRTNTPLSKNPEFCEKYQNQILILLKHKTRSRKEKRHLKFDAFEKEGNELDHCEITYMQTSDSNHSIV